MTGWRLFDLPPIEAQPQARMLPTALGAIAERVVEARCMEHGLAVARPSVDDRGVDLIVQGTRVQVKSTSRSASDRGRPEGYRFSAGGNQRMPRKTFPEVAVLCDVLAFYAHDSRRLWLLSAEEVRCRWRGSTAHIRRDELRGLDAFDIFRSRP